jgi:hypothetical protein
MTAHSSPVAHTALYESAALGRRILFSIEGDGKSL